MLPWLTYRYAVTSPEGFFGMWILTVLIVDIIAFAIDIVDIFRYVRGEKAPIAPR